MAVPKIKSPTDIELLRAWSKCAKYKSWKARKKPARKGFFDEMSARYVQLGYVAPTEKQLRDDISKLEKQLKILKREAPAQPTADTDLSLCCDALGLKIKS